MTSPVLWLDVRNRIPSLLAYSLGMAAYMLLIVALYPAFKNSNSLDQIFQQYPAAAAAFGISGSITSPSGWLAANAYANFFPLIVLLMTIGYGAAAIAGQNEDGTLALVVTTPKSRRDILLQKCGAMVLQAAILCLAVVLCVVAGRWFQLSLSAGVIVTSTLGVLVMGLDFGLLGLAVGAITGSRGLAIGISTVLASASYLVSSLAPVVSWVHNVRFASLFYWSVGDNQIVNGSSLTDFAVLVAVCAVAVAIALGAFTRMDLR